MNKRGKLFPFARWMWLLSLISSISYFSWWVRGGVEPITQVVVFVWGGTTSICLCFGVREFFKHENDSGSLPSPSEQHELRRFRADARRDAAKFWAEWFVNYKGDVSFALRLLAAVLFCFVGACLLVIKGDVAGRSGYVLLSSGALFFGGSLAAKVVEIIRGKREDKRRRNNDTEPPV